MDTPVIIAIVVAVVIIAIIIAVVMSRSNDKETPRRRSGAAGKRADGPRTDGPRTDGPRTDGPRTDGRERTRDVPRGREDDGPRRPRNRDGRGDRDDNRR
jgi:hypothetical protein